MPRAHLSALLLALAAVPAVLAAQHAPLTLVSTKWSPLTNDVGQARFALDLVEAALKRIGVTSKTTIVSDAEFTNALLAGRFDGSAAAWKDAQREQVMVFSQPYLENRLVLIGRRGADVSATALPQLAGRRIALVGGYAYGDAIELAGPVFVRSRSEEDSLTLLLKGAVDYTLMDDLVVQYLVHSYPKESAARLQIGATPLVKRELYFALRRSRADAPAIIDSFNAQLRNMIADRTYHRLLHVDWIRADVDGDGVAEYVPSTDRAGTTEPQHAYSLFTTAEAKTAPTSGFYLGGTIYADWASVPASYKDINSQFPDARRSSGSIFKFTW
jgi:polar amino acid transport system substrate-binding protein